MRRTVVLRLGGVAGAVVTVMAVSLLVVVTHRSSAALPAAETSPQPPAGTYVLSDDPKLPTVLRSCPRVPNAGAAAAGECGALDYLPDYSTVIMRCWVDGEAPPGTTSPRWFYVNEVDGPHPGYSGYVYSGLVKQQTPTPACTDAIISQYEMPKYVPPPPLGLTVTGSCTTASGTLTAVSSNFTPGTEFEVSATYPNGSAYPLVKTSGTVNADGSVPWTWPCAGDPPGAYSTELVDLATGRTVTAGFNIAPAPAPPSNGRQAAPPAHTEASPHEQTLPAPVPPQPATRIITVHNQVTNGSTQMREDDKPAYLSTVTHNYCRTNGCMLPGTEVGTGAQLTAVCQVQGDRTTNGQDNSSIDDHNPGLYSSPRWYGIRWSDGRFGYLSEVWINGSDRGGLGLPTC